MTFDWVIRPGDLLSFMGFLIAGAVFFFGLRQRIELVAQRLGFIEESHKMQASEIVKLGELLIQMGRYEERMFAYDQRIIALGKRVDDLQHGQGFINGPRLATAAIP